MPTLKGTEASLSYVQCFLDLASSSVKVLFFILHSWTLSGQTLYSFFFFLFNIFIDYAILKRDLTGKKGLASSIQSHFFKKNTTAANMYFLMI